MRLGIVLVSTGIGGAEKRFLNYLDYLGRRGEPAEVFLIVTSSFQEAYARYCAAPYQRIHVLKHEVSEQDPFPKRVQKLLLMNLELCRVVRELRLDVVHNTLTGSHLVLPALLLRGSTRFIHEEVNSYRTLETSSNPAVNALNLCYLRVCHHVLSLSPSITKVILAKGISHGKVTTLPNSFIDLSRCYVAEKSRDVVFCGRFSEEKSPLLFLEVACLVLKVRRDVTFHALGCGPMEDQMRRYAQEKGLGENLVIRYEKRVEETLARSAIFLSLQKQENYPSQSLQEAMASKNAVIATDVGDTRLLVSEKSGFLVGFDPREIADRVLYLLDHPAELEEKARHAFDYVRRFSSVEAYAESVRAVYGGG